MKENIDIRELIKQFTEYLADSDYSEDVVTRLNRMLRNGILKFAEEKGVITYSTSLGNEFLADLRSRNISYSPWYLSLFKLHSYYCRGYIVKREQYRYGELQDLHIKFEPTESEAKMDLETIIGKGKEQLRVHGVNENVILSTSYIWDKKLAPFIHKVLETSDYSISAGNAFICMNKDCGFRSSGILTAINYLNDILTIGSIKYNCKLPNESRELYWDACHNTKQDGLSLTVKDAEENAMPLDQIFSECIQLMAEKKYTDSNISRFKKFYENELVPFASIHNITCYTKAFGKEFLQFEKGFYRHTGRIERFVFVLDYYLENKQIIYSKNSVKTERYIESEIWQHVLGFLDSLKALGRSPQTIYMHQYYLYNFVHYLHSIGINHSCDIRDKHVLAYIENSNEKNHSSQSIRLFALYLYDKHETLHDFGFCLKRTGFFRGTKLPSVYTTTEIKALESSINQSSAVGKRDYAMILLMSRLGLRTSDVCRMTFENIDWEGNMINITQYKTQVPLKLPLLKDVGEAIINYLKYGRPKSDLPNIFITASSPYRPISRYSATVARIITDSGILVKNRKRGTHSLRHSLASRMLDNGTPLPIISAVLGHTSTQTTMDYLKIDKKKLVECELSVPCVENSFFLQMNKSDEDVQL